MMQQQESLFEWIDGRAYFRGLPVERHVVTLAGKDSSSTPWVFEIAGVKDAADLLDQPDFAKRFVEDDLAPYGLELWPAARMLAEHVVRGEPGAGRSAIELGCGLALVSVAAALSGWRILATDNDQTSLRFAEYNAGKNNAEIVGFELLDWNHPREAVLPLLQGRRFDRVFAADVLYQLVDHAPILRCIDQLLAPDGVAVVADPNRGVADRFETTARDHGFIVEIEPASATDRHGKTVAGRVFALRRIP